MNAFKTLGLSETFDIDIKQLANNFQLSISKSHPDNFISDPALNLAATNMTIELTKSYEILKDPLKRAIHLLELKGINFDMEKNISDQNLLIEQMTFRIELDEAQGEKLQLLKQEITQKISECIKQISLGFAANNQFEQISQDVLRLQFFNKLNVTATNK